MIVNPALFSVFQTFAFFLEILSNFQFSAQHIPDIDIVPFFLSRLGMNLQFSATFRIFSDIHKIYQAIQYIGESFELLNYPFRLSCVARVNGKAPKQFLTN